MDSQAIAASILSDVEGNMELFAEVKASVESTVEKVIAAVKARIEEIADESQAKEVVKLIVQAELEKVAPLAAIESFVNSRLPMIIRPIAPIIEGSVVPKAEIDGISLAVETILGLIDKKYGATWFADLKAKLI